METPSNFNVTSNETQPEQAATDLFQFIRAFAKDASHRTFAGNNIGALQDLRRTTQINGKSIARTLTTVGTPETWEALAEECTLDSLALIYANPPYDAFPFIPWKQLGPKEYVCELNMMKHYLETAARNQLRFTDPEQRPRLLQFLNEIAALQPPARLYAESVDRRSIVVTQSTPIFKEGGGIGRPPGWNVEKNFEIERIKI